MVERKRLSVIGAWSDLDENLVQVIYEDNLSGTVYIERVQGDNQGVTCITTTGNVRFLTLECFQQGIGKKEDS
jgi:hypothetical protein